MTNQEKAKWFLEHQNETDFRFNVLLFTLMQLFNLTHEEVQEKIKALANGEEV